VDTVVGTEEEQTADGGQRGSGLDDVAPGIMSRTICVPSPGSVTRPQLESCRVVELGEVDPLSPPIMANGNPPVGPNVAIMDAVMPSVVQISAWSVDRW
jgi:hypothetical protein